MDKEKTEEDEVVTKKGEKKNMRRKVKMGEKWEERRRRKKKWEKGEIREERGLRASSGC